MKTRNREIRQGARTGDMEQRRETGDRGRLKKRNREIKQGTRTGARNRDVRQGDRGRLKTRNREIIQGKIRRETRYRDVRQETEDV